MSVLINITVLILVYFFRYVASLSTECTTCWATCTSTLAVSLSSVLTAPVSSTWRGTWAGTWRSNMGWKSHQRDKVRTSVHSVFVMFSNSTKINWIYVFIFPNVHPRIKQLDSCNFSFFSGITHQCHQWGSDHKPAAGRVLIWRLWSQHQMFGCWLFDCWAETFNIDYIFWTRQTSNRISCIFMLTSAAFESESDQFWGWGLVLQRPCQSYLILYHTQFSWGRLLLDY